MSRSWLLSLFRRGDSLKRQKPIARAQIAVRWAASIGYLILALGIPISLPGSAKRSTEPYPCMNHPCGCQSAEECWHHCCCFTLEQRLAWARDNHVTPPDYALAEARAKGIDWEKFCAAKEPALCPCHAAQCDTCCEHSSCGEDCNHEHVSKSVVLIQALKCQGAGQNWIGLSISLPPPPPVNVGAAEHSVERVFALCERIASPSFSPPTPPPRALTA